MKLSKGFNKVLSLVLAGAMVLTGITVTDTKKADAAMTKDSIIAIAVKDNTVVGTNLGGWAEEGEIRIANSWSPINSTELAKTITNPVIKVVSTADKVQLLSGTPSWKTVAAEIETNKEVEISSESLQFESTVDWASEGETGKSLWEVAAAFENSSNSGFSLAVKGDGITSILLYDKSNTAAATAKIAVANNVDIDQAKATTGSSIVTTVQGDFTVDSVEISDSEIATVALADGKVNVTGGTKEGEAIVSLKSGAEKVGEFSVTNTLKPAPTKAPASGSGSSTAGSSSGGTSSAGTGEPTELPEDQWFDAYIGLVTAKYYPTANDDGSGYKVSGFDQQNEELPQTQAVEIDSTGVYSVALTGNMAEEANGVIFFALYTEMTEAIQKETGLIVKPVEVIYGSDTIKKFPSTAFLADGKKMRYSFVNQYAKDKAEANQFEADDFTMVKDEGVYIKFVVAYSEEDAAKLVENYDDADTYDDIQDEVKEAKEELASKATPAPTPTTKPDVKPTAKPTAKPTVAPTLKVAGKVTMGAKEKVTVKATTNQASVKAVSSKTSAVKASASGKNIKLTAGKKAGSANITVTAGTKKATIKVTVKAAPKKIKVAKKTVNVKRGKKATTKVKFTPKKAAAYTIKVTNASQLKKKKVTVTVVDGKITVKADKKAKKGTLTVKLQTYNKKKTTFKVKVK